MGLEAMAAMPLLLLGVDITDNDTIGGWKEAVVVGGIGCCDRVIMRSSSSSASSSLVTCTNNNRDAPLLPKLRYG